MERKYMESWGGFFLSRYKPFDVVMYLYMTKVSCRIKFQVKTKEITILEK